MPHTSRPDGDDSSVNPFDETDALSNPFDKPFHPEPDSDPRLANPFSPEESTSAHQLNRGNSALDPMSQARKPEQSSRPLAGQQSQQQHQCADDEQFRSTTGDEKNRTLAGILGLVFGAFGVHNFYVGFKRKALVQVGLALFTALFMNNAAGNLLYLGLIVWSFLDAICIFLKKGQYKDPSVHDGSKLVINPFEE
ncbi:TM2 domain-containing protein [Corynebacterium renale]|uniref:TM2 domain-containing membrane protein YozV n=1 Tax=Corynebacterium renale TaxID=1724 RepID=A0A2A9DP23_9CORY|nr:TM2 domain-containing protein [Corynebacterium renale]PFG28131.1 TM2 domain-containing membrane protein YozV [Corynebacterium renale]